MISIILPSWDDYRYLKPCLKSIKENTFVEHEILIHLNTYTEELEILASQYDSNYTKSEKNEGIAFASNRCAERAKYKWLYFPNSDMIFLPDWDTALLDAINMYGDNNVYSSTMIEPKGNNENFIIKNYGYEPEELKIKELLNDLSSFKQHKFYKRHTVPYLIPRSLYEGMDERMWPGWVTDDDIVVSIFTQEPNTKFIRVSDSNIYHFMCKSTHRIGTELERKNLGIQSKLIFDEKWNKIYPGMNTDNYRQYIYSDFKGMSYL